MKLDKDESAHLEALFYGAALLAIATRRSTLGAQTETVAPGIKKEVRALAREWVTLSLELVQGATATQEHTRRRQAQYRHAVRGGLKAAAAGGKLGVVSAITGIPESRLYSYAVDHSEDPLSDAEITVLHAYLEKVSGPGA